MIDFRYHLVSLISVFLALAVGIALGAGPLKESIGDTLTGQVEQLRTEKDALRADLDVATADRQWADAALVAASDDLIGGILAERRVAVVRVGQVPDAVQSALVERIEQAGGSVTGTVQVTEAWTDPDQRAFRESLGGTLLDYLDPVPGAQSGSELAEALVQSLVAAAPEDPDARAERAGILLDLLREAGLVATPGEIGVPADLVVVLAGPVLDTRAAQADAATRATQAPEDVAALEAEREAVEAAVTRIALAAQARSGGAVVASGAPVEDNVLLALRRSTALATTVSTVDSIDTEAGRLAVPMALAARVGGTVGHFGRGPGADAALPERVELLPILRVDPAAPEAGDEPGTEPVPDPDASPEPTESAEAGDADG